MNDFEVRLIRLYARHGAAAIRSNPALAESEFDRKIEQLAMESLYQDANAVVAEIADYVEERKGLFSVPVTRAKLAACLQVLLDRAMFSEESKLVFEHKFDVLRAYLAARFGGNADWSAEQSDHFDFVSDIIKAWKTYFLSYTNRSSAKLNLKYDKVIGQYVNEQTRQQRDTGKDNILADAVVNCMESQNLNRSFYDRAAIGPGGPFDSIIGPAARGVFALLQIVEDQTFRVRPEPNWSYHEYRIFEGSSQKMLTQRKRYAEVFQKRFLALLTSKREEFATTGCHALRVQALVSPHLRRAALRDSTDGPCRVRHAGQEARRRGMQCAE